MKYTIPLLLFIAVLFLATCKTDTSSTSKTSERKQPSAEVYLEKGKTIASATFNTLSGRLQKAMQSGGVAEAVSYCNLAAYPLVDSLAKSYHAQIKRTSFKLRNPENKPTPQELIQLQAYQQQLEKGEVLKPLVKEIDAQTIAFYAPIHVMPLCEKCHGIVGETIAEADYQVVQKFYPDDQAIGYTKGDWRGMWSISFKK